MNGPSYGPVKAEAQRLADETGFDYGVEKLGSSYRTWQLPQKRNRFGFELRCEVVMCTDYRKQQPGHGFYNSTEPSVKSPTPSVPSTEDKMSDSTPKPLKMKRPLSEARQEALRKAHAAVRAKAAAKQAALNTAGGKPVEVPTEVLSKSIATITKDVPSEDKPVVLLVGQDGNAFMILGQCRKAARKAGWDAAKIEAVMSEMQSGDYDNLLAVAMKHFDVR